MVWFTVEDNIVEGAGHYGYMFTNDWWSYNVVRSSIIGNTAVWCKLKWFNLIQTIDCKFAFNIAENNRDGAEHGDWIVFEDCENLDSFGNTSTNNLIGIRIVWDWSTVTSTNDHIYWNTTNFASGYAASGIRVFWPKDFTLDGQSDRVMGLSRQRTPNTVGSDFIIKAWDAAVWDLALWYIDKDGWDVIVRPGKATWSKSASFKIEAVRPWETGADDRLPETWGWASFGWSSYRFSMNGQKGTVNGIDLPFLSAAYLNMLRNTSSSGAWQDLHLSAWWAHFAWPTHNVKWWDVYIEAWISEGTAWANIYLKTPTPWSDGTADNTPTVKWMIDWKWHMLLDDITPWTTVPTAVLELKAGTSDPWTAPFKLKAGTNLATPETWTVEFDWSYFYLTIWSTRRKIPVTIWLTAWSILFAGTNGEIAQDNTNLFWDDTLNALRLWYIIDANSNELLKFISVASAVNEISISNSITGVDPKITATWSDTNIWVTIQPKGNGTTKVIWGNSATQGILRLYEALNNWSNYIALQPPAALAGNSTYTLPAALPTTNGQTLHCDTNWVMYRA